MRVTLSLAVAAVATTVTAADTKKPVAKWTCEEFLAFDNQYKPKVIYWASAHAKGGRSILDIDGTEKVTPMIIDDCRKAPQASFWQKLQGAWNKVEAQAKAEAKKVEKKL
ncbi:MAG: HNS-dependent expression A [Betaproteobacteria bacterium]|nr:HNS-dependent expression A [Betaproteobacteria bacterium]